MPEDKKEEKSIDDLKAELETLRKENETLKTKPPKEDPKPTKDEGDDTGEDGLHDKARKSAKSNEERQAEHRSLEKAVTFNHALPNFLKDHEHILPNEFVQIVQTAEKEKYDSQLERSNALKAAFIQSFFSLEDNREMLTDSQKAQLDDYLKLTKLSKEQRAAATFENIFEPALMMIKKIRKAEELGRARSGGHVPGSVEAGYLERLKNKARKTYNLGEGK